MNIADYAKEEWSHYVRVANLTPDRIFKEIEVVARLILDEKCLVLTLGAGKSSYPAGKFAASLRSIGVPAFQLNSGEILHGDLGAISNGTLLIGFSFSGETHEVSRTFAYAKSVGVKSIGITGDMNSSISRLAYANISLDWIKGGDYAGIVPTLSSTIMNFIIDVLLSCVAKSKEFSVHDFAKYHPDGSLGRKLSVTVGEIMSERNVIPIFYASTKVTDCVHLMSKYSQGLGIVVNEKEKLIGVISDGDLRRFMGTSNIKKIEKSIASDIMCHTPAFANAEDSVAKAIHLMLTHKPKRVSSLPVIRNEKVCGLITLLDIETFRSEDQNDSK